MSENVTNGIDGSFGEEAPVLGATAPQAPVAENKPSGSDTAAEVLDDLKTPLETLPDGSDEAVQEQEQEHQDDSVDYKGIYDKIFQTPIKAAGKEIKLSNPDEVIRLAQMGIDYNRKMEKFKQDKALVSALKKAGVSEQSQINQMIEIMNGNPKAIQKLIVDKGLTDSVNDMSFEEADNADYTPKNYVPSVSDVELGEILDSIQTSTSGINFVRNVTDSFDAASKGYIAENPQVLQQLHNDSISGDYDLIMDEVNRRLTVSDPRTVGLNTLSIYGQVGNEILQNRARQQAAPQQAANGSFNSQHQNTNQQQFEEQRRNVSASKGRSTPRNTATNDDRLRKMLDVDFDELDDKKLSQHNNAISQFLGAKYGRL